MKTYSLPSRTWVHRAGRDTHAADSPFGISRRFASWGLRTAEPVVNKCDLRDGLSGSFPRVSNGSASNEYSTSSGLVQGRDSRGKRKPMGESPGIRNNCVEAVNHGWLVQASFPDASGTRRNGSTNPMVLPRS